MKKFWKIITTPFRQIKFGVVALILGALCLLAYTIKLPAYQSYMPGTITPSYIFAAAISPNQAPKEARIAICDANDRIYVLDNITKAHLLHTITLKDFPVHASEIRWLSLDEQDNLYVLVNGDGDSGYLDYQYICKFDANGKYLGETVSLDFSGIPNAERDTSEIITMRYYDNALHYIYYEDAEARFGVYKVEPSMGNHVLEYLFEDLFFESTTMKLAPDGVCSALTLNGYAETLDRDEQLTDFCASDVDLFTALEGQYLSNAIWNGKGLFIVDGLNTESLMFSDGISQKYIAKTAEIYPYPGTAVPFHSDQYDEAESVIDEAVDSIYEAVFGNDIESNFGDLYDASTQAVLYSINDTLYLSDLTAEETIGCDAYQLPFGTILLRWSLMVIKVIGWCLIAVGAFTVIGCLMGWHFTMLTKQLFIIIPIVTIMLVFITNSMRTTVVKSYNDNVLQELVDVSSIIVNQFDGDAIGTVHDFTYVTDGIYSSLNATIDQITGHNTSSLNQTFDLTIYRYAADGHFYQISSSVTNSHPFSGSLSFNPLDYAEERHKDSNTYIITASSSTQEFMTALTPIYDSNGQLVGLLELATGLYEYKALSNQVGTKMLRQSLVFIAAIVFVISLITFFNTRQLKKASTMVSKIADGDFSVRVKNASKDEVGAICLGVSNMAGQLETYFEEKNRNEQFYYKFVPEKFKELLHKDQFTDLTLGDAESMDLTVLFCDIRGFSLNSEMMTARENFEFVNLIYGIAGPIVRAHGGFVDKYIGDAVMALFEHADDAIDAGIDLYQQIAINPETAKAIGISSIDIGIGIHSGMARIGIVGEEARMAGTVISDTVNMSSRLESLTKQYKTAMIITKETLDRMADPDRLLVRYLGMVQVAGVNEVESLYEVLDSLDDTRKLPRSKTADQFREAVRLFHLGKLEESLQLFEVIEQAANEETDPVPAKYASYIQALKESGVQNRNVFQFSRK